LSEYLLRGVRDFNHQVSHDYHDLFAKLLAKQVPDALFIGCSDSRVLPNILSQSEPGELFVVRNVGNIIPISDNNGIASGDESEASAIEYGLGTLKIDDLVVCGHSSCGAMNALLHGRENIQAPNLRSWLRHADGALKNVERLNFSKDFSPADQLSQANVLHQLENIKTYPIVQDLLMRSKLKLHAWWFDLTSVKVYSYNPEVKQFEVLG
jgi:carbonic anhydrase